MNSPAPQPKSSKWPGCRKGIQCSRARGLRITTRASVDFDARQAHRGAGADSRRSVVNVRFQVSFATSLRNRVSHLVRCVVRNSPGRTDPGLPRRGTWIRVGQLTTAATNDAELPTDMRQKVLCGNDRDMLGLPRRRQSTVSNSTWHESPGSDCSRSSVRQTAAMGLPWSRDEPLEKGTRKKRGTASGMAGKLVKEMHRVNREKGHETSRRRAAQIAIAAE